MLHRGSRHHRHNFHSTPTPQGSQGRRTTAHANDTRFTPLMPAVSDGGARPAASPAGRHDGARRCRPSCCGFSKLERSRLEVALHGDALAARDKVCDREASG
eukprot:3771134-Prymnesium_polylepis.1